MMKKIRRKVERLLESERGVRGGGKRKREIFFLYFKFCKVKRAEKLLIKST